MTKALVIGGGIAGPTLGVALRKAGFEAEVFEAHARGADGVGAFLTVAVNGLLALRELDLLDALDGAGFDTPRMCFVNGAGAPLGEVPAGPAREDGLVSRTIRRAELYARLRDEAIRRGVGVRYGKRLVEVTQADDGVIARFADGTEARGDVLVGADGLRSRTRELLDPGAARPRYTGLLNTGGYARGVDVEGEPGVLRMVFGTRAFFAYVKAPDGEVWWFANPAHAEEPTRDWLDGLGPEVWRARLLEAFAADRSPAVALIEASPTIFGPWATCDVPRVRTWHAGRVCLVGDAAHATSPSSGQGASMAIDDALELGRCLRDLPDVPAAFRAYEGLRRARVERVVAIGKRTGDSKEPGPVGRWFRDLVLPVFLRQEARASSWAWLYERPPRWEARVDA